MVGSADSDAKALLRDGVLAVLVRDEAKRLFGCRGDQALLDFVSVFCAREQPPLVVSLGGQGEVLYRCLNGGTLEPGASSPPLNACLVGGRQLYRGEDAKIAVARPDLVPHLAKALGEVTPDTLRQNLEALAAADSEPPPDATLHSKVVSAWQKAAAAYAAATEARAAVVCALMYS